MVLPIPFSFNTQMFIFGSSVTAHFRNNSISEENFCNSSNSPGLKELFKLDESQTRSIQITDQVPVFDGLNFYS